MDVGRFFSVFKTASKGLAIQRRKIAIAGENIANASTTTGADGTNPYKPKMLRTSIADVKGFEKALQDTAVEIQTTNSAHSRNATFGSNSPIPDLGPSGETIELEKYRFEYDPFHPDADDNGMVKYPDIDMVEEMTEIVSANRLYEANLSVIEAEKEIIKRSLEI